MDEGLFRGLVEAAFAGMYMLAGERFVYTNPRIDEMFGYARGELAATKTALELIVPAEREVVRARLRERETTGRGVHYVTRGVRKDGTEFDLEIIGSALDAGGTRYVLGTALDVSERNTAQAKLAFERRRLATIFEQAPALLCVLRGPDHVFEMLNEPTKRFIGNRDVIGLPVREAMPEIADQGFLPMLDAAFTTGEPVVGHATPFDIARHQGAPLERRYVDFIYQPLVEVDGSCSGIVIHGVDVTDQVLAEQRARSMFKGLPVPTYAWQHVKRDDREELVLVDYNDEAVHFTQGGIERLLGGSAEVMFASAPSVVEDLWQCMRHGVTIRRELDYTMVSTGVKKRIYASYSRVQPDLVLCHTEDVTERHNLEEQLRQAQKMEAVGLLAGGVAHDFNNLLTVIQSCSEFLAEALAGDETLLADVGDIQKASARAAALTSQLLAFSRKQVLRPKSVALDAIVAGLLPMLGRLIGEDIRIELDAETNVSRVRADPGQIEQVVMNLALNSRDAMPAGGTLTVSTANVSIAPGSPFATRHRDAAPGTYVMLAIGDTGCGMDEPTRARVFEPFFTTKDAGRGTGLGLSTVYGIVTQSGGSIAIESEIGKGTVVEILLPVDRTDTRAPAAAGPTTAHGNEVVLLVEDEDAVRALSRRALERDGYLVLEAMNGRDALRIADAYGGTIDLLLTDVVMPEMGGRDLYEALRRVRPEVRVLYVSGYTDDEILRRGGPGDGAPFLQKPFARAALASAVRAVIDS